MALNIFIYASSGLSAKWKLGIYYSYKLLFMSWLLALGRWTMIIGFATCAFTIIYKRASFGAESSYPIFIFVGGAKIRAYCVLP